MRNLQSWIFSKINIESSFKYSHWWYAIRVFNVQQKISPKTRIKRPRKSKSMQSCTPGYHKQSRFHQFDKFWTIKLTANCSISNSQSESSSWFKSEYQTKRKCSITRGVAEAFESANHSVESQSSVSSYAYTFTDQSDFANWTSKSFKSDSNNERK